jgi:hypothetical protein
VVFFPNFLRTHAAGFALLLALLAGMAADTTDITEITGTPTATAIIMAMTMRVAVIWFASAS